MPSDLLISIQPSELKFPFELKKQISASLRLVNVTSDYVAFKVKTTSPKKYCVRPNTGVVPPQSSADVTVMMQAQKEAPVDMQCKDKFLVQSVSVPPGASTKDVTQDLFNKESGREIHEAKLRVVYVDPPEPLSPVKERGPEPSPSNHTNGQESVGVSDDKHNNEGFKESSQAPLAKAPNPYPPSPASPTTVSSGWGIIHLLLVAVLAFVIGYFYGQAPAPQSQAS